MPYFTDASDISLLACCVASEALAEEVLSVCYKQPTKSSCNENCSAQLERRILVQSSVDITAISSHTC